MSLYTTISVGDTILFPKSMALVKGGKINKIKGLNGHAKEIWTDNGGHFIASRYRVDYVLSCEVNHTI